LYPLFMPYMLDIYYSITGDTKEPGGKE